MDLPNYIIFYVLSHPDVAIATLLYVLFMIVIDNRISKVAKSVKFLISVGATFASQAIIQYSLVRFGYKLDVVFFGIWESLIVGCCMVSAGSLLLMIAKKGQSNT